MKILQITNNFPPIIDGVGDYTFFLSQEMSKQGNEVVVICQNQWEVLRQHTDCQASYQIRIRPVISKWDKIGVQKVLETIKSELPDWVILQYVPYSYNQYGVPLQLFGMLSGFKEQGGKIAVMFHEVCIRPNSNPPKSWLISATQKKIAASLCRIADKVITSIDFYAAYLKEWKDEVSIIPIGSNIPPETINPEEQINLKKKLTPYNEFLISTFGIRNVEPLLKAFLALEKKHKIKLLICGKTKQNIPSGRNNIFTTGVLPANKLFSYLKASDLFVLPDNVTVHGEGGTNNKSGSLAAALGAGLPVIGMKGDMNNKLLLESGAIEFTSYKNLENTINYLIEAHEERSKLKERGIKFFREYLSWEQIASRYAYLLFKEPSTN